MVDAFLGALDRPDRWPIALLGFMIRGGILVLSAPIVVIPSTIGVANSVAPTVTPLLFGEASPALVLLIGGLAVVLAAWLVLGGLVGTWSDLALVRAAAAADDAGIADSFPSRPGLIWRALATRLIAHIPLALALGWGSTRIVDAAYREVILPDELATPIVLRVLLDVPDALGLVLLAWLFGETAGGIAQRRLWSSSTSIPGAVAWALGRILRRPLTTVATVLLSTTVVAAAVVPPALVAGLAWEQLGIALATNAGAPELAVSLVLFVMLWFAALALTGAAAALRSFAWTAETYRPVGASEAVLGDRTIGETGVGRPGEWPSTGASGSL